MACQRTKNNLYCSHKTGHSYEFYNFMGVNMLKFIGRNCKYNSRFKAKVALEALLGESTLQELVLSLWNESEQN